jgi:WD40 repeat protein
MATDTTQSRLIRAIAVGRPASTVAWSPDGQTLAIGDDEGGVRVWNLDGQLQWRRHEHFSLIQHVAWSPDGARVASAAADGSMRIWNARHGHELSHCQTQSSRLLRVAWAPDGRRFAWGAEDRTIRVWDAETASELMCSVQSNEVVWSVAWSPDGRRLATGLADRTIRIWDAERGRELGRCDGLGGLVWAVAWAPDGRRLASGGSDHAVDVWDAEHGNRITQCLGHEGGIRAVAWSPDGRRLASGAGGSDRSIRVWNPTNGRAVSVVGWHTGTIRAVAFAPRGGRLASVCDDHTAALWAIEDLVPVERAPERENAITPWLTRQLATIGRRPAATRAAPWVPHHGEADGPCLGVVRAQAGGHAGGRALLSGFSPDGQYLATDGADHQLRWWRVSDGVEQWHGPDGHDGPACAIAWSADGYRLASGAADGGIRVWNAGTGSELARYTSRGGAVRAVAWSPDRRRLASGGEDRIVRVWNTGRGSELLRYEGHAGGILAVAWSPDNSRLASASADRSIQVWDAGNGTERFRCNGHNGEVVDVAWAPDGDRLASVSDDGTLRIWEAEGGVQQLCCHGHQRRVLCVAWSRDGGRLATASDDGTIRVWNGETGSELARFSFPGEDGPAQSLVWGPDSAYLVSAHHTFAIRFWDTRTAMGQVGDGTAGSTGVAEGTAEGADNAPATILPAGVRALPAVLAMLHRFNMYPPLSLVQDLRDVLGGAKASHETEGWRPLLSHPGFQRLTRLRWPPPARTGLLLLLLRGLPPADWAPPAELPPERVALTVGTALTGGECPADVPPLPLDVLIQAADGVDERVGTLLAALGPDAVAADPGLPLRLLPQVGRLPPLNPAQQLLLSRRLTVLEAGSARGEGGGLDRVGLSDRGPVTALLTSQFALPAEVIAYRHLNGGLLYRARSGSQPPQLRPVVLVLDVSPAVFGPVESLTRPAAHAVASTLRRAGLPVVLVTVGGKGTVRPLNTPAALLAVLTERSLALADCVRAMICAEGLRRELSGHNGEPVVLLLSHPWFGAEEPGAPVPADLRALFVQYPGFARPVRPAWADRCRRWETLAPTDIARLPNALGRLIG